MQIPCLTFPFIYHVGNLNKENRGIRGESLEGHLLSVSNCPGEWMTIARLGENTINEVSFVDHESPIVLLDMLKIEENEELIDIIKKWGLQNGFLKETQLWRAYNWDCEIEEWRYATCLTEREAFEELSNLEPEGPDGGSPVQSFNAFVGTEKMASAIQKKDVYKYDCFEYAAILWAQINVPYVIGAWWDEALDIYSYSAPRGGVFPDQLYRLKFKQVELGQIELADPEVLMLSETFVKSKGVNQTIIDGIRSGLQSCSFESANLFMHMDGITHYCVFNRINSTLQLERLDPRVADFFVRNQNIYADFCLEFDASTKATSHRKVKMK